MEVDTCQQQRLLHDAHSPVTDFPTTVTVFCTAIAAYELLVACDAPEPIIAGMAAIACIEWVILIAQWSIS